MWRSGRGDELSWGRKKEGESEIERRNKITCILLQVVRVNGACYGVAILMPLSFKCIRGDFFLLPGAENAEISMI